MCDHKFDSPLSLWLSAYRTHSASFLSLCLRVEAFRIRSVGQVFPFLHTLFVSFFLPIITGFKCCTLLTVLNPITLLHTSNHQPFSVRPLDRLNSSVRRADVSSLLIAILNRRRSFSGKKHLPIIECCSALVVVRSHHSSSHTHILTLNPRPTSRRRWHPSFVCCCPVLIVV